jgi:cytidylate kinase
MLDRLEEFRRLAQKEGISLQESLVIEDKEKNNDRELIDDFLVKVKEAQKAIVNMEKKNLEMREIVDKQKIDKTSNP